MQALGQVADRPFQQPGGRPQHRLGQGAGHGDVPLALVSPKQRFDRLGQEGLPYMLLPGSASRSYARPASIMSCT